MTTENYMLGKQKLPMLKTNPKINPWKSIGNDMIQTVEQVGRMVRKRLHEIITNILLV